MSTVSVIRARETRLPVSASDLRPTVCGKFIFVGSQKFFIKGVTYGAFRRNDAGEEFHDIRKIRRDFAMMVRNGINTVRIQHTVPPTDVLDAAGEYHLRVMVGLGAEQHIGHLLDGKRPHKIFKEIRGKVRTAGQHPALLSYALGNEIPAGVARWWGRERIERYLHDLYKAVKDEDPEALVTYVNYPSTEYLQLPFLDLCCFNVFLEKQHEFRAYLARLQNIALDRPLVMSELGLDSLRNGVAAQAEVLDWQIRTSFEAGCAGAVVFSWTDEWYRFGDVHDWQFGLTDRQRRPRPALSAVAQAFEECPFPPKKDAPFMSVVVCSYNGSRTIGECLDHLTKLDYPNYEIIVVDDGSTDNTSAIAERYNVRLIRTENRGLSAARNTGREHAHGDIVIYIDDDAYPDVDWLNYYRLAFEDSSHALIGGPNFVPLNDPPIAQCVARAPGGPTHVLLTDTVAEHVPGCNMAFRKSSLEEIGGFDHVFRVAGDDVDICWRIQERGWTIGFAPAAVVWHHRRPSIRTFWKQQRGYGKAEALLQQKWPSRFNASNHLPWAGRIYRAGVNLLSGSRAVIYHGVWGEAPFQGLHSASALWEHLAEVPELYLLNSALLLLSALGLLWRPMLLFIPFLCIFGGYPLLRAALKSRQAQFAGVRRSRHCWLRVLTAVLHALQPLARLYGRLQHGLTPWKRRGEGSAVFPFRRHWNLWTDKWVEPRDRLRELEQALAATGLAIRRGNAYEAWDLEIIGGLLGSTRVLMATEDHGAGNQYIRLAAWPRYSKLGMTLSVAGMVLTGAAAISEQFLVAAVLGSCSALLLFESVLEAGRSLAAVLRCANQEEKEARTESAVTVLNRFPAQQVVPRLHAAAVRRSGPDG
jgi:GT2 family glycosyltransferase